MNPGREQKISLIVNAMVLRDAPPDEVFQKLTVNDITGDAALKMYQNARSARILTIRKKLAVKVFRNIPWLLAFAIFTVLQEDALGREAVFKISILVLSMLLNPCFIPAFIGLWRILNPLYWIPFAAYKKGSFDDET